MAELRGILPHIFTPQHLPIVWQQVVQYWKDLEVDAKAEEKMPVLADIHGHRRREVMAYMDETAAERDKRICENLR